MLRNDDLVRMRHMLDYACETVALGRDRTREDLDANRVLNLALVRLLEIIGEAAARVSEDAQAQHPAIPWLQIVGLRNRLIHGCDSVDMGIPSEILTHDLPALIEILRAVPGLEQRA